MIIIQAGLARNVQFYSLWPCRIHKQSTEGATLGFYLRVWSDLRTFTHPSKIECSASLGWMYPADILVRGSIHQKLPATSGDQFAQLSQCSVVLYNLLQADVYQSRSSQLFHFWNIFIMQPPDNSFCNSHLKFLGWTRLPTRDSKGVCVCLCV